MAKQGGRPYLAVAILIILLFLGAGFFYGLTVRAQEKVNINTADAAELESLPGVGPVKARAIIAYREENGPFGTIADIKNVSGIGDATFANISGLITVAAGAAASVCGNGVAETGEACDDGNTVGGDGCDAQCRVEQGEPADEATSSPATASSTEPEIEAPPAATSTPPAANNVPAYRPGDVVINEFVSDPADGDVEWIELYNTTGSAIALDGWTISEGSKAVTALSGTIAGSGSDKFTLINKPKGNLNNSGDTINLNDSGGQLIDRVAYGDWDDGNIDNNAPAASDPDSVARSNDGYNTHNNRNDFIVTTTPTPDASNIISGPDSEDEQSEISEQDRANYDYSNNITISEIYPNPPGADNGEFIELYNGGERDVSLASWRLGDASGKKYGFGADTTIGAGGYLAAYREDSKLVLNNGGDSVDLYQPFTDKPFASVKYDKAREGFSYVNARLSADARYVGSDWVWSETVTPGEANSIQTVNHSPVAEFAYPAKIIAGVPADFDSSDSDDEDSDLLRFFWEFGDGATNTLAMPEHTYFRTGSFAVKLTVSDGETETSRQQIVTVVDSSVGTATFPVIPATFPSASGSRTVVINELLPSPVGPDAEEEWIELYNRGGTRVNLLDWRLDDSEGGSSPYTFTEDFWLEAGGFRTLGRPDSGLALNNDGDEVRLYDIGGALVDLVVYGKAGEGEAYARAADGGWEWTVTPTPGYVNAIAAANNPTTAGKAVSAGSGQQGGSQPGIIAATLDNIDSFNIGDRVRVRGTVAVLPGIMGVQYFYVVATSSGLQIYSYKKDFPDLAVGDLVDVTGAISSSNDERRIKTSQAADIKVIGHGDKPAAAAVACEQVDGNSAGRLVTVTGEIVERSGSTVYLDDGTDEARIYLKSTTGVDPSGLTAGKNVVITGLVNLTQSGPRILPRSPVDIIDKDAEIRTAGRVLGEIATGGEWTLAARDRKLELFRYLLIMAGAMLVFLLGLSLKLYLAGRRRKQ